MRDLLIVIVSGLGIALCMVFHKYGGSLAIGVGVGAVYFLKSITSGSGIADVQIGTLMSKRRKPIDPASSISMGLAASGIAAGAMGTPEYTQSLGSFLPIAVALGILISIGYSVIGIRQERARLQVAQSKDDALKRSNSSRN